MSSPPNRRAKELLARGHPVAVAFDGVDLAVVAHHAERLTQRPSGESIGRKPLVVECDGDFVVGIAEIQIECPQRSGIVSAL